MRKCRHLAAFELANAAVEPAKAPAFVVICEDCAAAAVEALEVQRQSDVVLAKTWARATRVLEDLRVPDAAREGELPEPA